MRALLAIGTLALVTGCGRIGYSPLPPPGAGGAGGFDAGGTGTGGMGGAGTGGMGGADAGGVTDATIADGGPACTTMTFGGHTYVFCETALGWNDAEADCVARGMRLVRIDDASEDAWIFMTAFPNAATSGTADWPWIGGTDQAVAGQWTWTDGTLFWMGGPNGSAQNGLYSHWVSGGPNDTGSAGRCAILQHSSYWVESDCANLQPYICEQY